MRLQADRDDGGIEGLRFVAVADGQVRGRAQLQLPRNKKKSGEKNQPAPIPPERQAAGTPRRADAKEALIGADAATD